MSERPLRLHMTGSEWFGTRAGGLNRYFESLFTALQDQPGVEVTAAAFGAPRPGGQSWGGVDASLLHRTRASARAGSGVDEADIVDRHFAAYGPGRRSLSSGAGLMVHFQGPWFAESLAEGQHAWRAQVKKWWERRRYAEADRAVVLCAEFGRILEREFGVPGERIRVLPAGVDLERFVQAPLVPTDRPLVLCVRRLERRMGIDVLLDAWPAVLRAVPDAILGIVGTGSEADALAAQVERLGLGGSATLHGPVPDEELTGLYARAALTVVPTRELEGFGLIALESLATGRPVVVTRCGGLPDIVEGLDPSLVVPIEDAPALGERIVTALGGLAPDADACRHHAEGFAWSRVAARHLEVYAEMRAGR